MYLTLKQLSNQLHVCTVNLLQGNMVLVSIVQTRTRRRHFQQKMSEQNVIR